MIQGCKAMYRGPGWCINQPFLIEELSNVWRWGAMAWGKFLSVEYMETVSMETEDYPYLYTFILYLAGVTISH